MANSMFTKGKISRPRFHTPSSYRSQRQLTFSSPASTGEAVLSSPTTNTSTKENSTEAAANALLNISTPAPSSTAANANADSAQQETNSSNSTDSQSQNEIGNISDTQQQQSGSDNETKLNISPTALTISNASPVLPWDYAGNKFTSLYKTAPPKLKYPGRIEVIKNHTHKHTHTQKYTTNKK